MTVPFGPPPMNRPDCVLLSGIRISTVQDVVVPVVAAGGTLMARLWKSHRSCAEQP